MTGRRDYRLGFQHFSTGRAVASFGFSCCLTGSFHSGVGNCGVAFCRDRFLRFQHFSTGRAVASLCLSGRFTGCVYSGVSDCGMVFCRDRFLRFQHFSAGRAVASFRLFGGLAGCFYGCVCYFGVTRCRQGIFPGGAAHIALIGCIAIFRTGRILMIYNFFVVIAENKYIVLICQIISVRIPIFHYDLHRLNAAFSQSGILIQAHAQKTCLTYGSMNALCIV